MGSKPLGSKLWVLEPDAFCLLQEDERAQNLFSKALEIAPGSALAACEMGDYLDLVTS
jgi:hypothetical protein